MEPTQMAGTDAKVEAKIEINIDTEPPALFTNYMSVNASGDDFSLLFCDAGVHRVSVDAGGNQVAVARIVSSLRMTPNMMLSMIQALASTWNRQARLVGVATGQKLPRFKLIDGKQQLEGLEDLGND